jgi:hypothetical protein
MDLQHHCLPSVGETIDQGDPPQRPAPVQALGNESGTNRIDFLQPARRGENLMTKMSAEIKAGILDEHRMGQAERDRKDSPPERGELVKPGSEMPSQVLKCDQTAVPRAEQRKGDALHRLLGHL